MAQMEQTSVQVEVGMDVTAENRELMHATGRSKIAIRVPVSVLSSCSICSVILRHFCGYLLELASVHTKHP